MAIICTSDDKIFSNYKDLIKSRKVKFHIYEIFNDWWDDFLVKYPLLKIRDIVFDAIDKILKCGNHLLGYSLYTCTTCDHETFVFNTCKSKFCPSCGNKYNNERATVIKSVLINHDHRHATFTIPEDLRYLFREDRMRMNILFKAVELTIKDYFKHLNIDATPAFICVLHTGGREINWNPHIHVLLLEGGIKDGNLVKLPYFSYKFFRKKYMYNILNLLDEELGKNKFKKLKNEMWNKYGETGFYVNMPDTKYKTLDALIRYVTRYLSRPIMAESRILDYDGTYVTFWYQRHEDDKIVIEKVHAHEFIGRLIIHVPEFNFKYIRYYGVYNNTSKDKPKPFLKKFSDLFIEGLRTLKYWQQSIINDFKKDPLECPKCHSMMIYASSVFP